MLSYLTGAKSIKMGLFALCFMPFLGNAQQLTDSLANRSEPEQRSVKKNVVRLLLPASMMGLGAWALDNPTLQNFNEFVRQEVLETNPNVHNTLEDRLRHLPSATTFFLQIVGVKGKNNILGKAAVYAIATTIGDQAASRLKTVSRHRRPDGSDLRSYPSGHTTTAFVAAEFLRKEYGAISPWIPVAGYTAAAATGALRVYHNKHWFTDVVAGAGLGILSTNIAYFMHSKIKLLNMRQQGNAHLSVLPTYQYQMASLNMTYRFK